MGKAIKLGVIGAGSAQFSLGLVRDLCLAESLYGSTVTFMDVDEGRLELIHRLAVRYVQELGIDLRFEATQERERALRDADFVLNTALVGGHEPEEAGRRLAEAHGYYRGVRLQTNFKQYEMMLSVARDMERVCPRAWLIQSSNPVFEGCTLITRETGIKVIGLCHGFYGYRRLAQAIGVPEEEIEQVVWEAPGVNHWIYLTQFRLRGQDLYPRVEEWIETAAPSYWASFRGGFGDTQLSRAAIDHYRRVGLMPIGDASRTFSEWYYHGDLETKRRWYGHLGGFDSELGWAKYLEGLERNLAQIRRVALDTSARVTEVIKPVRTREIQVPIIDAITNDRPGIFQVNVPNGGAIEGIAPHVVVEGKAKVDGGGVQLLHVGRLPDKLMHLVLNPRIAKAERELAAFVGGDRDLLLGCLLIDDHRSRSLEQAEAYLEAVLAQPWNGDLAARFGQRRRPLPEYQLQDLQ
ncbi:MAG TPA: alpha-glucosidase/alpha-galactosidase [Chloroflexota bacterium]|nr:alpha-glucosidase/alpha-galactosidase [Chloroflexota bacterium]